MMIEKIIRDFLAAEMPIPVIMEKPEQKPDEYVLIEKTGARIKDQIKSATIAIQSVSTSLYEAAELNETVKAKMETLILNSRIGRVKLDTDYNFTNPATKEYRYQAVYDLIYR